MLEDVDGPEFYPVVQEVEWQRVSAIVRVPQKMEFVFQSILPMRRLREKYCKLDLPR